MAWSNKELAKGFPELLLAGAERGEFLDDRLERSREDKTDSGGGDDTTSSVGPSSTDDTDVERAANGRPRARRLGREDATVGTGVGAGDDFCPWACAPRVLLLAAPLELLRRRVGSPGAMTSLEIRH